MVLLQGLLGDRLPEVTASLTDAATRQLKALIADPAHHHGTTASIEVDTGSASRFIAEMKLEEAGAKEDPRERLKRLRG
jgi:Fe-S cluster assembly iron-binding protein IscA